jgi:nitrite reductase/ring-hydroxylating ferredoxin subunit
MGRKADIETFVDALVGGRRPPRFKASREDAGALRVAATLASARPGADAPSARFVARLHAQLATAIDRPQGEARSRRSFLSRLGLPAVAALAGAASAFGIRDWMDASRAANDEPLVADGLGSWVAVASVSTLQVGQPLRFTVGPIQGFLIRQKDDQVDALSAVCTHLGCALNPNPEAGRLDCPCHGASFSFTGEPLSAEYQRPLPRMRTRITGDWVEVYALAEGLG